ncbi:MAG TPA: DUF3786 domain-containing protein [Spirochaetota bacterium]|nr:DUF3786 domain-containing protein [Spirochaetota bacterium]
MRSAASPDTGPEETNRERAVRIAIERAAERLAMADMEIRARLLELPNPTPDGELRVEAFGRDVLLAPPYTGAVYADSGVAADPVDHLLVLHYLLYEGSVDTEGDPVSFRELPGGQFYWEAFRARTVLPLISSVGNRLEALREQLGRFDCGPSPVGDIGARVRCIGKLGVSLAYHAGDDEFPPSAELFFDAAVRRVFTTEDAAAMAQRLCALLIEGSYGA